MVKALRHCHGHNHRNGNLSRTSNICIVGLWLCIAGVPISAQAQASTDPATLKRIGLEYQASLSKTDSLAYLPERITPSPDSAEVVAPKSGRFELETQILGLFGGRPLIYATHNRRAAATVRTTSLHIAGRSGLGLHGSGREAAIWDAGNVLITHRELKGRVAQRDTTIAGATHATHVAGTMAASGIWEVALGMAPEAMVSSYNWVDDVVEMANAASQGLTLSNHSYGVPLGWTPNFHGDGLWAWMGDPKISTGVDFRFGWYDQLSASWDAISHAAPFYLIVKSAGNERESQGPRNGEPHYVFDDGWLIRTDTRLPDARGLGYDTIGDAGVAKNVLTVGATESAPWGINKSEDVKMTDFSGWGPTDDGRIKPDIVAPGVQLMSSKANSDEDYGPSSGTSMASPVVAGSAVLLQELFEREFGLKKPLSSTIKGLIIHTADEAGVAPGPDYQFGWGQLNTERAALHLHQAGISSRSAAPIAPFQAQVIEDEIVAGALLEFPVHITKKQPFRATLTWTDPAGTVVDPVLDDPTIKLVHDLDLSVLGPGGTQFAWTLDPKNPSRPAERGKNIRDNVEQALFEAEPGLYTVQVRAPGVLTTPEQYFSLMVGEASEVYNGDALSTVSGRVTIGNAGVQDVTINVRGPKWVNFKTLKDGVFYLADLPPGRYTVFPSDPILSFSPASFEIDLPLNQDRLEFSVVPIAELTGFELLESPRLLHTGEVEAGRRVQTAAAGGVYGLTLVFSSPAASQLSGLKLHIDSRFDPRIFTFSGVTGNRVIELSPDWTLSAFDSGHLTKRIPAIWFDGSIATPYDALLPYSIRTDTDQILLADTLTIRVDRPDDMAPIPNPSVRLPGLAYAPVGSQMEVRAGYLDGSRVRELTALLLDRDNESIILYSIPLRDSGSIESDLDIVKGDGIYSAKFIPQIEADYRLAIRTVDVHGNENTLISDSYYSSLPFTTNNDFLFWTTYEQGSQTKAHEKVFDRLGFGYSWWDELTRGQIKTTDLKKFDVVISGRHSAPIRTKSDMDQLSEFVSGGGNLVILGENPVNDVSKAWMRATFGVQFQTRIGPDRVVVGQNQLEGFRASLSPGARPSSIQLPPTAMALITVGGEVVAAKIGTTIISTLSAASFDSEATSQDLLSRLLFLGSNRVETVVAPLIPNFINPSNTVLSGDFLEVEWPYQGFAAFEIEFSTLADFSDSVARITSKATKATVGPLERGKSYFARIRAINPAGNSDWSETLTFSTRPTNRAPVIVGNSTPIHFGVGNYRPFGLSGISALFTDPDSDALQISLSSEPTGLFTASIRNDSLVVTPILLRSGQGSVTLTAKDPDGLSAALVFPLTLDYPFSDPVNRAPLLLSPATGQTNLPLGERIDRRMIDLFADPNGDPMTFQVSVSNPENIAFSFANDVISILPLSIGRATLSVQASDGRGGLANYIEVINVIPSIVVPVNLAPIVVLEPGLAQVLIRTAYTKSVAATFEDPDGEPLTLSLTTDSPEWFRLENDSLFAFFTRAGSFSAEVTATDPRLGSTSVQFRFKVSADASLVHFSDDIPVTFSIVSVYPLPFSDRVTFVVNVPEDGFFRIHVFALDGREVAIVADQWVSAGSYEMAWRPERLPAGAYIYQATWSGQLETGQLETGTLVKWK